MTNQKTIISVWFDFIVCFFLGFLGIHKFREKKIGLGIVYLCTCGLFLIGWLIDCIKLLKIAIFVTFQQQNPNDSDNCEASSEAAHGSRPSAKKIILGVVAGFLLFLILVAACAPDVDTDNSNNTFTGTASIPETTTQANTEPTTESISVPTTTDPTTAPTTEPATAPTTEPTTAPTTKPTTAPTTEPTTEPTNAPSTEPPHTHSFSAATCSAPKTCSCGATEGNANGHSWKDATCSDPKTCTVCGTTSGLTAGHNFSDGRCTICGKTDPDYNHETMVWIPTKGGTKYHTRPGCSNMDDPEQVTKSEAESRGFTPCKRCH